MSGDCRAKESSKGEDIVLGHRVTQTSEAKWLCIENIYEKLHRPHFYDIGGTYNNDIADYWFMCKIESVSNNFLLHLFVCNFEKSDSVNISVSFRNDLQFDRQNGIAYLPLSLKHYNLKNVKEMSYNYITTYNFSDFEVELLKEKKLHISVGFPVEFKVPLTQQLAEIQMKHDLGSLLSDPVGSNFTIESQDGEKFEVHKALLSAHSEVFKAMFKEGTAESQNNYVKLTDVGTKDLRSVLEFLYTGTLKDPEQHNFFNLLMLADLYNIRGMLELCQHYLCHQITKENVFDTLALAEMYNADILKTSVLKYVRINATSLYNIT